MRRVIVPNSVMINSPVKTFNSEDLIRSEINISVHYDTDLKKACEIIKETINEQDFIREKDDTNIIISNFGESGIDII
jgi:small-conductance mechanosensitive channel